MNTKWDGAVSREAWEDLCARYEDIGGEDADDHELAELLRQKMIEVEG